MTKYLKQGATNAPFLAGPFLDTDGAPVTGLTIAGTDYKLYKGTDDAFFTKDQSDGGTHEGNGYYSSYLNATDLDTAGWLRVMINKTGALPVWEDFTVLAPEAYDALINDIGVGIRSNPGGVVLGEVVEGTLANDQFTTDLDGSYGTNDIFNGRTIIFLTGNNAGSARLIDDYVSDGTVHVAVNTLLTPVAGDKFAIVNGPIGATAEIADGSLTAAKFADNFLTAAKIAADAVDKIHDEVVEGSLTHRQIERILLAALAGKSTGGGTTTVNFRDVADSKNRITATVDEDGNRTAVTRDGT